MKKICLVVATTEDEGIGLQGKLPWRIKRDMTFFKELTLFGPDQAWRSVKTEQGKGSLSKEEGKENVVIMGRKTWDSIPSRFRPLSSRLNIVVTRQPRDLF